MSTHIYIYICTLIKRKTFINHGLIATETQGSRSVTETLASETNDLLPYPTVHTFRCVCISRNPQISPPGKPKTNVLSKTNPCNRRSIYFRRFPIEKSTFVYLFRRTEELTHFPISFHVLPSRLIAVRGRRSVERGEVIVQEKSEQLENSKNSDNTRKRTSLTEG